MIKIKQTIFIKASPEKVWKLFSSLDLWPKMNHYCRYAKHTSGPKWAKGSTFKFKSDYGLFKFVANPIILKSNPPYFIEWAGTRPFIKGKHSFTFKKNKKGTEVINYEEFTGIGLPLVRLLNLKAKIEDSFREFNLGLKREAEK
jgi:hypothetical protein